MPRAGLDRDAVVRLGLRVVDEQGAEALTLASVAALAGVAVPSLYKHVASLADLRRRVAIAALEDLVERLRRPVEQGVDPVRAFARATRAYAHERPGRYAVAQSAGSLGAEVPAAGETVRIAAEALQRVGSTPGRDVDAVRALRAAVHGFVVLERQGGFGLPDDVDASFEAMLDVLIAGFVARAPAR